jgi:hypothetical protein
MTNQFPFFFSRGHQPENAVLVLEHLIFVTIISSRMTPSGVDIHDSIDRYGGNKTRSISSSFVRILIRFVHSSQ